MPELSFVFAQAVSGLTAAMFLFLIASGLSLIFGVLRVLNFAHGTFYMLGAYAAYQFVQWFGVLWGGGGGGLGVGGGGGGGGGGGAGGCCRAAAVPPSIWQGGAVPAAV